MGLMSQMYIPYCCFVYITEKNKYFTKIIKCDEELIIKKIGSIDVFKEKINWLLNIENFKYSSDRCKSFVMENSGSTEKIIEVINE